jgi:hypothetical protein
MVSTISGRPGQAVTLNGASSGATALRSLGGNTILFLLKNRKWPDSVPARSMRISSWRRRIDRPLERGTAQGRNPVQRSY